VTVFARPAGSVRYEKFEADVAGGAADGISELHRIIAGTEIR
jgi:hypothetical protein